MNPNTLEKFLRLMGFVVMVVLWFMIARVIELKEENTLLKNQLVKLEQKLNKS